VKWQIGRNVNNDEAESLRTAFAAGAAFAHKRLLSAIEADMDAAFAEWLPRRPTSGRRGREGAHRQQGNAGARRSWLPIAARRPRHRGRRVQLRSPAVRRSLMYHRDSKEPSDRRTRWIVTQAQTQQSGSQRHSAICTRSLDDLFDAKTSKGETRHKQGRRLNAVAASLRTVELLLKESTP
jgi:hypothetical protein